MSDELQKISSIKKVMSPLEQETLKLAQFNPNDELAFHNYIKGICQRLMGDSINFDEENIFFALSDIPTENAAFFHGEDAHTIFVTDYLFDSCDNEDQLAFILAHELGHWEEQRRQGAHLNTKAEETASDLRAIQKMAQGGYNLEEAHKMAEKLFTEHLINFDDLKDAHQNDTTRKNAIDAMIMAQKNNLIENGKIPTDEVHPFDDHIMQLRANRPKSATLASVLNYRIMQAQDTDEAVKIWMDTFHQHLFRNRRGIPELPQTEIDAFKNALEIIRTKDKGSDKMMAEIFTDLERNNKDPNLKEQMLRVLNEVYSLKEYNYLNADLPNSRTGAILRYYLKGFREAEGKNYEKMIENLEYVKSLVACHSFNVYQRILVSNFNLLELDFNENDINKKFSPQIMQYIRKNLNAVDKFETFSSLTAYPMGNSLLITNPKKEWCTLVNADGIVESSFPQEDLLKMHAQLTAKVICDSFNNVQKIRNGEISDNSEKILKLIEAYNTVLPFLDVNDFNNIIKIRGNAGFDVVKVDEILPLLPPQVREAFSERNRRPYSFAEAPYTAAVVEELAKEIAVAPKEKFSEISESLHSCTFIPHFAGQDKILHAFLSNPAFIEVIREKASEFPIVSPNISGERIDFESPEFELKSLTIMADNITDLKLKEHLLNGGDFNSFEAPFREDIKKICNFGSDEHSDDQMEESIYQSRDKNRQASFWQEAYSTYYSYEALKDGYPHNLTKTFGSNIAGKRLSELKKGIEYNLIELGPSAKKRGLTAELARIEQAFQQIYARQVEQIYQPENWTGDISYGIYQAVNYNKNHFQSIVKNADFLVLALGLSTDRNDLSNEVFALNDIVQDISSSSEKEEVKRKIWEHIGPYFSDNEMSVSEKVKLFTNMAFGNLFNNDCKNYYDTLVGPDGKGGLLSALAKENDAVQIKNYIDLLNKNHRIPDPDIRTAIIKNLATAWIRENENYNDITASPEQRAKILENINNLKHKDIAETDKIELLKEIAEQTLAQKEVSLALKPKMITAETSDKEAILTAYGLDGMAYVINNYPATNQALTNFLLGEGNYDDATNLVENVRIAICQEHDNHSYASKKILDKYLAGEDVTIYMESNETGYFEQKVWESFTPENVLPMKKEFDAAPLEIKSIIVNELLTQQNKTWEDTFSVVSGKLFDGAGDLAKVGSDFLHSYIAARPDSEKNLYLAAMMAAASNKSKNISQQYNDSPYTPEQRNLAKGLRLFLESSGPAGTKLAQAMSSYSEVPDYIRYEMQFAKSNANPPARWEIFEGREEMTDILLQKGPLGKRRGSASFFVTYDLGDDIVKILRRGAQAKADNEFAVYKEMLSTLSTKYDNLSSFSRLVKNAADNVKIETDLSIGLKQFFSAQRLYPKQVSADGIDFKIEVMDWKEKSAEWAILKRAKGADFKDLPSSYKTAAAKAVFTTELANMLSGKSFDSDRHAGQYKFDTKNNVIGVFDTGSMSMVTPTEKEQTVLGTILARTLIGLKKNPNMATVFSQEIDKATNEFYRHELKTQQDIPPYLSEFQRGLLALNDFYKDLSAKELITCVRNALNNGQHKIHPNIVKGFTSEITKNVTVSQDIILPESSDKLAPEARADRRIGKILFDNLFEALGENKEIKLNADHKILSKINSSGQSLQIVKGMVRGAYEKLKPSNYSAEERRELGAVLYRVCHSDVCNAKLNKNVDIKDVFNEVDKKIAITGKLTKNISKMLEFASMLPISESDINRNTLKRAIVFAAFTDPYVAKGYNNALNADKSISLGTKLLRKMQPFNFIPHQSTKLMVKAMGKKVIRQFFKTRIQDRILNATKNNVKN